MIVSRKHAAPRCGAGYSLGELVIALGILAIALPIVATAFLAPPAWGGGGYAGYISTTDPVGWWGMNEEAGATETAGRFA